MFNQLMWQNTQTEEMAMIFTFSKVIILEMYTLSFTLYTLSLFLLKHILLLQFWFIHFVLVYLYFILIATHPIYHTYVCVVVVVFNF